MTTTSGSPGRVASLPQQVDGDGSARRDGSDGRVRLDQGKWSELGERGLRQGRPLWSHDGHAAEEKSRRGC